MMDEDLYEFISSYVCYEREGKIDADASKVRFQKSLERWIKTTKPKTRNHGERGEDTITRDLGALPLKSKGAVDHTCNGRNLGDKTWTGQNPTILNARRVIGKIDPPLTDSQLHKLQSMSSGNFKYDRASQIISDGHQILFAGFDNQAFEDALSNIDPNLPLHLGRSVIGWRVEKPSQSLVIFPSSKEYSTFSEIMMYEFLFQSLVQTIKPTGFCSEIVNDLCFLNKYGKRFFVLSNEDHLSMILSALGQNAYFDGPSESRYPPEITSSSMYFSFQIRLRYHPDFDKGMSKEEYDLFKRSTRT